MSYQQGNGLHFDELVGFVNAFRAELAVMETTV